MSSFLLAQRFSPLLSTEPDQDAFQHRYEWTTSPRPDVITWTGPMLWPSPRLIGGDMTSGILGTDAQNYPGWFEFPVVMIVSGMSGGYFLCGVTKDPTGTPLGSCTVTGYRTVDDLWISECVSGPTGEYCFTSWTNAPHYLVAYLPGVPDVAGTTVNTLTPDVVRTY